MSYRVTVCVVRFVESGCKIEIEKFIGYKMSETEEKNFLCEECKILNSCAEEVSAREQSCMRQEMFEGNITRNTPEKHIV